MAHLQSGSTAATASPRNDPMPDIQSDNDPLNSGQFSVDDVAVHLGLIEHLLREHDKDCRENVNKAAAERQARAREISCLLDKCLGRLNQIQKQNTRLWIEIKKVNAKLYDDSTSTPKESLVQIPSIKINLCKEDCDNLRKGVKGDYYLPREDLDEMFSRDLLEPPWSCLQTFTADIVNSQLFMKVDCYKSHGEIMKDPPRLLEKLKLTAGSTVAVEKVMVLVTTLNQSDRKLQVKDHREWGQALGIDITHAEFRDGKLYWTLATPKDAEKAITGIKSFANTMAVCTIVHPDAVPFQCYKCFQPGHHMAKNCKQPPRCGTCSDILGVNPSQHHCSKNKSPWCYLCKDKHSPRNMSGCRNEKVRAYLSKCESLRDVRPHYCRGWKIPTIVHVDEECPRRKPKTDVAPESAPAKARRGRPPKKSTPSTHTNGDSSKNPILVGDSSSRSTSVSEPSSSLPTNASGANSGNNMYEFQGTGGLKSRTPVSFPRNRPPTADGPSSAASDSVSSFNSTSPSGSASADTPATTPDSTPPSASKTMRKNAFDELMSSRGASKGKGKVNGKSKDDLADRRKLAAIAIASVTKTVRDLTEQYADKDDDNTSDRAAQTDKHMGKEAEDQAAHDDISDLDCKMDVVGCKSTLKGRTGKRLAPLKFTVFGRKDPVGERDVPKASLAIFYHKLEVAKMKWSPYVWELFGGDKKVLPSVIGNPSPEKRRQEESVPPKEARKDRQEKSVPPKQPREDIQEDPLPSKKRQRDASVKRRSIRRKINHTDSVVPDTQRPLLDGLERSKAGSPGTGPTLAELERANQGLPSRVPTLNSHERSEIVSWSANVADKASATDGSENREFPTPDPDSSGTEPSGSERESLTPDPDSSFTEESVDGESESPSSPGRSSRRRKSRPRRRKTESGSSRSNKG